MSKVPLRERAQGRWGAVLPQLGLQAGFLSGKNGPCPWCGGRDRWRFIDRDGSGNWICSQGCGKGDGLALAQRLTGQDFAATAKRVEEILRIAPPAPPLQKRREVSKSEMKRLWDGAMPLAGTPGEMYFNRRGLPAPAGLRYTPQLWYSREGAAPAILAKVATAEGLCANLYRIFITKDGEKAPIEKPKMMMRARVPLSIAVRLGRAQPIMGIAEGIENAVAATLLSGGMTVWATLGTNFLENFAVPEGVEKLVIWADSDENFAGQKAAFVLANRAVVRDKVRVEVQIPPRVGCDWNDVWLQQKERAAA